jgi:hypothetical protein
VSAWVVSKLDVDLLVKLALEGPSDGEEAWALGGDAFSWWTGTTRVKALRSDALPDGPDQMRPSTFGAMLQDECIASVRYRYNGESLDSLPGTIDEAWRRGEPYEYTDPGYRMTIAEAFKLISCYEYQSCEHPEWGDSQAKRVCDALKDRLGMKVPGWNAAPWGWSPGQVAQRRLGKPAVRR